MLRQNKADRTDDVSNNFRADIDASIRRGQFVATMQDSEIHGDWQRILSDKDLKVYEDAIRQLSAHHKHSSASLGLHTKAKTLFEKLRHEDCVGTLEYFNAGGKATLSR